MRLGFLVFLSFCLVSPAFASDGVLEINQTCATLAGCFPGDDAGFPVTITKSGSYRLTSTLSQGFFPPFGSPTTAIEITTGHVQIDLGGFSINCVSVFAGEDCPSGTGASGITSDSPYVRISNGTVTGMPTYGIDLFVSSIVENVTVSRNGDAGIIASTSRVSGCIVRENKGAGIRAWGASEVTHNVVVANEWEGIRSFSSIVSNNIVRDNEGGGIYAGESTIIHNDVSSNSEYGIDTVGSMISTNTVQYNQGHGIVVAGGSIVSDNVIRSNHASGIYNEHWPEVGVNTATYGTIIRGNNVQANWDYGLQITPVTTYRDNMITGNGSGAVNAGVNLGGNFCTGLSVSDTSCP